MQPVLPGLILLFLWSLATLEPTSLQHHLHLISILIFISILLFPPSTR